MLFTIGLLCTVFMIGFAAKIIKKSKETAPTVNLHPEAEPTIPVVETPSVEEPVKVEITVETITSEPTPKPTVKAKRKPAAKKTNKPK